MKEKLVSIACMRNCSRSLGRLMMWIPALALAIANVNGQSAALGKQFPLYVYNAGSDSVVKVDSSGNQTVFASSVCGFADGILPTIAFDGTGNLYVSCGENGLKKVDSSGNVSTFASGISVPTGLAFDTNGVLYVLENSGSIWKVDSSGNVSGFIQDSTFLHSGLAFDSSGNLYAANVFNPPSIAKFDSAGNRSSFASFSSFSGLSQLAFDAAGNLYVSAFDGTFAPQIIKIDPSGNQSVFASGGNLTAPASLAFDASGNLYVADIDSNSIIKIDSAGSQSILAAAGNLDLPQALAFTRPPAPAYQFGGFLGPVSGPPVVNTGKAGKTYPIKWQLKNASGNFVSDLTAVKSITFQPVSCTDFTGDPANSMPVDTPGNSGLTYDSVLNQYQFIWKTPSQGGCYALFLSFDTGQVFSAYFDLN